MVTTSYLLVETAALLQHRFGLDAVRDLEERIVPLLEVIWVTAELRRRALARLFSVNRRQLSLVDAVSFAIMEAEGLSDVLRLDADFTAQGFRLAP